MRGDDEAGAGFAFGETHTEVVDHRVSITGDENSIFVVCELQNLRIRDTVELTLVGGGEINGRL